MLSAYDIGTLLRQYRLEKGLNIPEVKQIFTDKYHTRVSEKTIYNWESGQYNISMQKFVILCEIYELRSMVPIQKQSQKKILAISPPEKALIEAYRAHPEVQSTIRKILDLPDPKPKDEVSEEDK